MTERIYNLVGGTGEAARLNEFQEEPFDEEDALQELIARNPELLAGEQMSPEDPPRWILISREAGIADHADGADGVAISSLMRSGLAHSVGKRSDSMAVRPAPSSGCP